MTEMTARERALHDDLDTIAQRAEDEKFGTELHRALARNCGAATAPTASSA
jgi:hypothetical protein